jgi:hypothetical protein
MANQLRITKADGTVHMAPIGTLRGHIRMNSLLPSHQFSRIEEVDAKGEKVIAVHEEGSGKKALAGQNEIAQLKAKIAQLEKEKSEKVAPLKEDSKAVIEKIKLATTEDDVNALVEDDQRLTVLKAAQARIAEINKK